MMDEEAKRRWQRAKPAGKVIGLPGYLVGGEWIGVSMPIACLGTRLISSLDNGGF